MARSLRSLGGGLGVESVSGLARGRGRLTSPEPSQRVAPVAPAGPGRSLPGRASREMIRIAGCIPLRGSAGI